MTKRFVNGRLTETYGSDELEDEDRLIRSTMRASLMSDTKWRKLFEALHAANLNIRQYVFKFVDGPEWRVEGLPSLPPPYQYFDHQWGPTAFRSIQWFLIPRFAEYKQDRTTPLRRVAQDAEGAAKVVAALGRYPAELSEQGLMITGHLPIE